MTSEKACYWVALGVVALFLSNHFLTRHRSLITELSDQSFAVAGQVSDHATRFVAMANVMFDRGSSRFARSQARLACVQARFASMQAVLARREAVLARVEAQRARVIAIEPMPRAVICPRQRLGSVPAL
jgi:hypothetical protein